MRRAMLASCLVLAFAGCGGDEDEASAPAGDPDQPVSSAADPAPPPAGGAPSKRACARLGRKVVDDPLERARARTEQRGCALRVAVLDGEPQILTEDYQPARINVRVDGGVVTGVEFMG